MAGVANEANLEMDDIMGPMRICQTDSKAIVAALDRVCEYILYNSIATIAYTATLKPQTQLIIFLTGSILAALAMTSIFQKFLRPFSSSTMHFVPDAQMNIPDGMQKATVAAGCFWGVEHMFRKDFEGKGLIDARVGYVGGELENPSYRAVCGAGMDPKNHAEACQIVFDPQKVSYRSLIEYFYKMHDPTTANRQGPDRGSQYRSGIWYHSDEQKSVAEEVTRKANEQWWKEGKIVTQILPAGTWWDAETYHQMYLHNNPSGYECPSHYLRKFPPLQ